MMDYIVLDIESPNSRGNSICAIGLLTIRNGEIADRRYSLINPEDRFDRNNSAITGITESMVLYSPTFPVYWEQIRDIVTRVPIVGHNIQYDLNVISKALDRYEIPVPEFQYICTLRLSQKLMCEPSYKLGSLAEKIGYEYQQHHVLEDAEAADQLFRYLIETYGLDNVQPKTFQYKHRVRKNPDLKLASNINDLHGIIEGITADGVVDEKEIGFLQKWIDENSKYRGYALFDHIITELNVILEDGLVTDYESRELMTIAECIDHSKMYNETTLGIQVLDGILKGITANQVINQAEADDLQQWLRSNDYLAGVYPYDKILSVVTRILEDGKLSDEENVELMSEIDEVLNPVKESSSFNLEGKSFCLTGDFKTGSRAEMEKLLTEKGSIKKSGVSAKVDYLFVGSLGCEAWKYGNVGGKIAKAQELQEKGKNIQIISEDDLMTQIAGN